MANLLLFQFLLGAMPGVGWRWHWVTCHCAWTYHVTTRNNINNKKLKYSQHRASIWA
ncbi:hypothetical protein Fmac_014961 [Flemingia macrophylla]|uniref:Secreted protein n=1 Tax=Flemingia macrophylla TaxID=520843 RepID=A0ABD1MD87_9FABA